MKVWDLRNDRDVPATTFMLSDQVKVSFIYYFLLQLQYVNFNFLN